MTAWCRQCRAASMATAALSCAGTRCERRLDPTAARGRRVAQALPDGGRQGLAPSPELIAPCGRWGRLDDWPGRDGRPRRRIGVGQVDPGAADRGANGTEG